MRSPLIPMTAVTGKPSEAEIYGYMQKMKASGIDRVMIYPRSGCEIEYLSEEWFGVVGHFLCAARELDMKIWLYDDFNWPSGDAGGRITAHEAFRLMAITTEGETMGQISCKSRHNAGLFGEKFFPNLLSDEAVEAFIACTHEEYYKRFSTFFGTVIEGTFTDEPSIGYCCTDTSIPYYPELAADYRALCGRDFYADMAARHKNFYRHATVAVSERFRNTYFRRLADWCRSHGILMTGHLMCDEDPAIATRHSGRFLRNLSVFSLPGIDEIYSHPDHERELTLFAAAQYAAGEQGAMAELFALGPCDMSYAKKRCMLYLAACHRINHYFLAISPLDMRGNRLVTDYFNCFGPDQPDFGGMRLLSEAAKNAATYAEKDFDPDVYIRYPMDACVKNMRGVLSSDVMARLTIALTAHQLQWKLLDDGDENGIVPVIEPHGADGYAWNGIPCTLDEILHRLSPRPCLTDKSGKPVEGIFVRIFRDGSRVILNLYASPGEYLLDGKSVWMDAHAVLLDEPPPSPRTAELHAEFDVRYQWPNVIRSMHVNGQAEARVICTGDFTVRLAVRRDVEAALDGHSVATPYAPDPLPHGMQALYALSAEIRLTPGCHTLVSRKDLKYLPSVLLVGDFSVRAKSGEICEVELLPRAYSYKPAAFLSDFGGVEFSAEVAIPQGATAIELVGTHLYSRVYVNEHLCGEAVCAPYQFPVEESLIGKTVILRIEQYSSLAPMFGDVAYWDATVKQCQWRGTPSPGTANFGFSAIRWVF